MSDATILTLQSEEKFCRICHDDQGGLKFAIVKVPLAWFIWNVMKNGYNLKAAKIVISVDMNMKLLWMTR